MSDTSNPIRLSAQAFIEALQGKIVQDMLGQKQIFLTEWNKKKAVVINNVEIAEKVQIQENMSFSHIIFLESPVFQQDFIIENGEFQDLRIQGGEYKYFRIQKGRFKYFRIQGGKFRGFSVSNGEFKNIFYIQGGVIQHFHIQGGKFQEFIIFNGKIQDINIIGNEFQSFDIAGGEFHSLRINGNKVQSFNITGGEFQEFIIVNGKFKYFGIQGGKFQEFIIEEGEFQGLSVHKGELQSFNIFGGEIHSLHFTINITFELILTGGFIAQLIFENIIKSSGHFSIRNLRVNQLIFENFINQGVFSIQGLQCVLPFTIVSLSEMEKRSSPLQPQPIKLVPCKLSFQNSWMGNMLLLNVDFASFQHIIIDNCKLDGISTYGKHFPIASRCGQNRLFTGENQAQEPKKLSDFYNQLHLAMQKQGHRANEMQYYAAYMEWHRLYLKESNQEWNTRASLYLHKLSTNYGQNWWKGVLVTLLLVGPFFYFLYTVCLPGVVVGRQYLTWENFTFFLGEYFNFLNPAHRVHFISNLPPGWASSIFDFLGRIAVGFMIYQIITAFRRFGRR